MNIRYESPGLSEFYSTHRSTYRELYPSERAAFDSISLGPDTSILDIGCACGGLGLALHEEFGSENYLGLEIHASAAAIGDKRVSPFGGRVICGDILEAADLFERSGLPTQFDVVVSLSALDWNTEVERNVKAAWHLVRDGGLLLMSLRLHPELCLLDATVSYQSTTPGGGLDTEMAPYVIVSLPGAVAFVNGLGAAEVTVQGTTGRPSPTAVTPIDECIFIVAAVRKLPTSGATTLTIASPPELQRLVSLLA